MGTWGSSSAGYENNADALLYTPDIDLTGCTLDSDVELTFWHWYHTEIDWLDGLPYVYDGGNVKISMDGGGTWNLIYPLGGYPCVDVDDWFLCPNPAIHGEDCYGGWSGGWVQATFDLNAYVGSTINIGWHFGSDECSNCGPDYAGWFIDDISIQDSGGSTGLTWWWTPTDGLSDSLSLTPTVGPLDHTMTYTLYVEDGMGCQAHTSITIYYLSSNVILDDVSICSGETATLTASIPTPWDLIEWFTPPGAGAPFATGVTSVDVSPAVTTQYRVRVCYQGCCAEDTATVFIYPDVDVNLTAVPGSVCDGESTVLTANVSGGTAPYSYVWGASPGTDTIHATTNPITRIPLASGTYYVYVTDVNGCQGRLPFPWKFCLCPILRF